MFVVGLLVAIGFLYGYEVTAIKWHRWPTITAIIHNSRDHLLVASGVVLVVLGLAVWAIWHLLIEGL
jgi:hypothetical protein